MTGRVGRSGAIPNYVVIRRAPGLPADFNIGDLEGKWFNFDDMPSISGWPLEDGGVAVPSGRFEVRDDGAVAEVYEVRP